MLNSFRGQLINIYCSTSSILRLAICKLSPINKVQGSHFQICVRQMWRLPWFLTLKSPSRCVSAKTENLRQEEKSEIFYNVHSTTSIFSIRFSKPSASNARNGRLWDSPALRRQVQLHRALNTKVFRLEN